MLKKFLPHDTNFFNYFREMAELFLKAAQQLQTMVNNPGHNHYHVPAIEQIEQEADKLAHSTFHLLDKTFITPFDRQDIHKLTSTMDDALDHINLTAHYLAIYELPTIPDAILSLIDIIAQCAELITKAISKLENLANTADILKICDALNHADDEAQKIKLIGIEALFREVDDFKLLLKTREIYGYTSSMVERCQNIANIIRSIVLEYT